MKDRWVFDELLKAAREAYCGHPETLAFTPFPKEIVPQDIAPFHCPCADVMCNDSSLISERYAPLQEAILAASPAAEWRETYKDTDIGADFMNRFGCYCIIGEGGPFMSDAIRLYMVYMPAHLYYPWHQHPAEEIYLVVSGRAIFRKAGCADVVLKEGQTAFHGPNQPHATETTDSPVLCLVAWRDQFHAPPVWTPVDAVQG